MIKSKMSWIGLAFTLAGVTFGVHSYLSTYIDDKGVLHESFSTPISVLFVLVGLVFFVISVFRFFLRKKIKKNTPLDYSDDRIWVYFELGGKKFLDLDYFLKRIDFINEKQIREVEYGVNLFICNQHIPEVVRVLEADNQGLYQIVRINE